MEKASGWWVFALALLGCGSDDDEASCRFPQSVCDIRTSDCQAAVFEATACVREQESAVMPPVRLVTPVELEAELRAELQDTGELTEQWSEALRLLGLLLGDEPIGDALVSTLVQNVVGFYDPEERRVSIVDGPSTTSQEDGVSVLAHEFVHALQDEAEGLVDLQNQFAVSTDSSVAFSTLVEGEATLRGSAVLAAIILQPGQRVDWQRFDAGVRDSIFDSIATSSSPFLAAVQFFPYTLGTTYLLDALSAGGQAELTAMYAAPPGSAVDWVQGYRRAAERATLKEPLDCYPTEAPAGFSALDHDQLGMVGPFGLGVIRSGSPDSAWLNSTGWRGDSVVLFGADSPTDPAQVAVAWRVRFETTDQARVFEGLASAPLSTIRVEMQDREVLVLAAPDAVLEAWAQGHCGTIDELPASSSQQPATDAAVRFVPTAMASGGRRLP